MVNVVYVTLLTVVASFAGTISGFGVATILTPALLFFLPYAETIFLVGIIHWFHDVSKTIFFHDHINWRLCLIFGLPSILMSFVGAALVARGIEGFLPIVGIFIMLYALVLLVDPEFKIRATTNVALFGGGVSGFLAGLFGVRGVVKGVFFSAFDLPKGVYLATMGMVGLLTDTTRMITYWQGGITVGSYSCANILAFIVASIGGAYVGGKLVHTIPQQQFRIIVAIYMVIAGLKLVIDPLV